MNSVKTKKTDDKILNLENQRKYKNSVDKIRILLYNTDINKERTAQSII